MTPKALCKNLPWSIVSLITLVMAAMLLSGCGWTKKELDERERSLEACKQLLESGFRPLADQQTDRFLGKVAEFTALCRGGDRAAEFRHTPWVDWSNYWATGDETSKAKELTDLSLHVKANGRGVDGALIDLEYQRIELIRHNLYDNSGTYDDYTDGRDGTDGPALKVWDEMRLPPDHPQYAAVGGEGEQVCSGELIRHRTINGVCNDIKNPLMGSTGTLFARNAAFSSTFPRLGATELVKNRHGDRLDLLIPDPQVISRKLLSRPPSPSCNEGYGLEGNDTAADCDYTKAPFFNVLATFWIQFMTHDWFSHLDEGHNSSEMMPTGCKSQKVDGVEQPLSADQAAALGCRPDDLMERALIAESGPAPTFGDGKPLRSAQTTRNNVTAWWDASQIYGYDELSEKRVKRDLNDRAKLMMVNPRERTADDEDGGYLPLLRGDDPHNPAWAGQSATGFPDNWNIGLSFLHNVFAREHNAFVDHFRARAVADPEADSGLRHPADPERVIRYQDVSDDEIFQAARLVVAAVIAKIHTIEWTTQLLYNEPLFEGMNSNWSGLFRENKRVAAALSQVVADRLSQSKDATAANDLYSVFASGPGIVGLGSRINPDGALAAALDPDGPDIWSLSNPDHVNGGVNHFGSPFNFPEEFTTVYRLHPLIPDLIEVRSWDDDPNVIREKVPVVETFRAGGTRELRRVGLADYGLSMGRQRLGALTLGNHPQFLQNLRMGRLDTPTQKVDVPALDILRDRERGVPRFNEFRRQIGLKTLTSFDDFVDVRLPADSPARREQERYVGILREVYGTHVCDASKVITDAQLAADGSPINDCHGQPDGSTVDNIEDVDVVVGMLAEYTRPHGFAISETQFHIFIINASRRLFSDRFFTSSYRPEFYSHLGIAWVNDNGPDGKVMEQGKPNGHQQEVAPFKRVLMRTIPELRPELESVVNTFDPWARDRGTYYSLAWKPRPGAESDEAFDGP